MTAFNVFVPGLMTEKSTRREAGNGKNEKTNWKQKPICSEDVRSARAVLRKKEFRAFSASAALHQSPYI